MSTFLSIVIPAYNEEQRLQKSLPPARAYLLGQAYAWEVILVDDGSADATAEIPARVFAAGECRVVKNGANRGKGYSVRQGVAAARGELVLITDADFSTPIADFAKLRQRLDAGYDLAIGSRSLPGSNVTVHQAWYREGMGRFFNKLVQWLVLDGFIDTQCGFKCFRRAALLPVFAKMTIDRFSFDVEMLYLARKAGLKIAETPVEWQNEPQSRVRIVRDSTRMLLDLLRIRCNDRRGLYG